jgi:predicted AAA+ superfamily ATPase
MESKMNYPRHLQPRIDEALADTPVVLVSGPRQAGKTTLVRQWNDATRPYLTLDDPTVLAVARDDPVGLVRGLDRVVIDEVQRAPQLLLAIKRSVDEDRRPGRFLLTGSANLMTLPTVADSLAGRLENLRLLPLSESEMSAEPGESPQWLDRVMAGDIPHPLGAVGSGDSLVDRVLRGGYPAALVRPSVRRRQTWARQYVNTLIERDVRDLASIDKLDQLPRLLNALAQMAGQLSNINQLAGQLGIDHKTAGKYVGLFEQMFLIERLPVWSGNTLNRLIKTPKVQFLDTGLLAALREITEVTPTRNRTAFGALLESFVFGELRKQQSWSDRPSGLFFYRDMNQVEVDFLLEDSAGQLTCIEVKATASVGLNDLSGLKRLRDRLPDRFKAGLLLYDGAQTLPMGEGLWAVPIRTLWSARFTESPG